VLAKTVEAAVSMKAIPIKSFERVSVDTTVQDKAIAHPTDSRLLDLARAKLVQFAKWQEIALKQSFEREGKQHRRKAAGYAHANQFKRMHKVIGRQRTIVGKLLRELEQKLKQRGDADSSIFAVLKERATRIQTQQKSNKDKLYAFHAPEVDCISKGKAKSPYEFGVEVSLAVTHKEGLVVGARSFPGATYDGHTLAEQLEQTRILLQGLANKDQSPVQPSTAVGDLGYRWVKEENPEVEIIQRGWFKTMAKA
jgi:IS5 family transposase